MNSLRTHSKKRLAEIASGEVKSDGRSTFKQRTWAEVIASNGVMWHEVREALFGRNKIVHPKDIRRSAMAAAWKQFSMFIRLRDTDERGRVKCITCPAVKYWRQMDAGHYVTTAKEATKYDENNVHAQCKGCNKWQGGKPVEYEAAIDRRYGPGTAQKIREKSVRECRRETWHYRFLEDTYRLRVENMRSKSPGKFEKPAA